MRFSSIVLSVTSIAAFAAAQSATSTTSSIPPNPTYVCVAACPAGDVSCQAECMGIPSPDEAAVNATTACAANCEQGDGSAAATDRYSSCVQACIASDFYTTTRDVNATPSPTGTADSGSGDSADPSPTGTGSDSSASGTADDNSAASGLTVGGGFLGLFAMAAGILVL